MRRLRTLNLIGNIRPLNRMTQDEGTGEGRYKPGGRYITSDPALYVLEEKKYYKVK